MNLRLLFLSKSLTLPAYSQCSSKAAVVPWVGIWDSCLEQQLEQGLVHEAVPVPQQGQCHCQPCDQRNTSGEKRPNHKNNKKIKEKKKFFKPVKILVKLCWRNPSLSYFSPCCCLGFIFYFCLCSLSYLDCLWLKIPACLQCEGCLFFKHLHDDHAVACGILVGFFLSLGFPPDTYHCICSGKVLQAEDGS